MMTDIRNMTADAVRLLKEMVAIKSPSFGEDEVCGHICGWLTAKGIIYRRAGNNIIARLSEQETYRAFPASAFDRTLMLCAHIDTVAASEDYSFDPYRPDYEKAAESVRSRFAGMQEVTADDIVAGLGSNDDGASVVSMIAVFRYFMERFLDPSSGLARNDKKGMRDILLVLSCEEERSGVNGMTGLWQEIKDSVDHAIVGEPTGMRAATSERGLLVIDATAHGVSGHAARNEGVNAIDIAMDDIQALKAHDFARISPGMGKVNLNVTQINAGTAHNVIPDICTFVIDIRPTEKYSNEEILAELQGICRSELKPRNLSNRSSATHEGSPLPEAARTLGIETFSSPTTSDWMRITCDAIKMGPGESSRSHKKDEFVFIKEIEDGIRTYIEFINKL